MIKKSPRIVRSEPPLDNPRHAAIVIFNLGYGMLDPALGIRPLNGIGMHISPCLAARHVETLVGTQARICSRQNKRFDIAAREIDPAHGGGDSVISDSATGSSAVRCLRWIARMRPRSPSRDKHRIPTLTGRVSASNRSPPVFSKRHATQQGNGRTFPAHLQMNAKRGSVSV